MTIIYLLLRLIAVIAVMLCGLYDRPELALVTVAAIIIYATFAITKNKRDATKLESLADQVYFVGYLSTIAAFAAVVLRIWMAGGTTDPRPILLMSGVALLTTMLSLMAMTTLKDYAQVSRQYMKLPEGSISAEMQKVLELLNKTGIFNQLFDISHETNETIKNLNGQLEILKRNVEKLQSDIGQGSLSALQFKDNVHQLQAVLDEFVRLLQSRLQIELQHNIGKNK